LYVSVAMISDQNYIVYEKPRKQIFINRIIRDLIEK